MCAFEPVSSVRSKSVGHHTAIFCVIYQLLLKSKRKFKMHVKSCQVLCVVTVVKTVSSLL